MLRRRPRRRDARDLSPEPEPQMRPYDDLEDDLGDDDGGAGSNRDRDRSPTPVHGDDGGGGSSSTPRKKKSGKSGDGGSGIPAYELEDWGGEDGLADEGVGAAEEAARKRKGSSSLRDLARGGSGSGGKERHEKKRRKEDRGGMVREKRGSSSSGGKGGGGGCMGGGEDADEGKRETRELWDTIAGDGEGSEDDQQGFRTADDDNFIDDAGVDPADRYDNDNDGHSPRHYAQAEEAEEDDEIERLFKGGKKKKKNDQPGADIGLIVEQFIAEFEVASEEDANLNRQSKPANNKLMKLPLLIEVLSKKNLQQEFLDHGILTLLKNWLGPFPDGSMPNMNIRTAVLKLLSDLPIDLEQFDRREQLKKSGLGKVIMFLSKSDEETTSNRNLAKELVDKWRRPICQKSTRFEDMWRYDDERPPPYRTPQMKKPSSSSSGRESRDDDLDADFSQGKSGQSGSRQHASRPEASPLDFVTRPQSKLDPEQIRARAKQVVQDQCWLKLENIARGGSCGGGRGKERNDKKTRKDGRGDMMREKRGSSSSGGMGSAGGGRGSGEGLREMLDTIYGESSEDDQEVDPADRYDNDNDDHSPLHNALPVITRTGLGNNTHLLFENEGRYRFAVRFANGADVSLDGIEMRKHNKVAAFFVSGKAKPVQFTELTATRNQPLKMFGYFISKFPPKEVESDLTDGFVTHPGVGFRHNCTASSLSRYGSPVFDEQQRVIGISYEKEGGLTKTLTVKTIRDELMHIHRLNKMTMQQTVASIRAHGDIFGEM